MSNHLGLFGKPAKPDFQALLLFDLRAILVRSEHSIPVVVGPYLNQQITSATPLPKNGRFTDTMADRKGNHTNPKNPSNIVKPI